MYFTTNLTLYFRTNFNSCFVFVKIQRINCLALCVFSEQIS